MITVLTRNQNLKVLISFSVYRTIVVLQGCFVVVNVLGVVGPYCIARVLIIIVKECGLNWFII